MPAEVARHLKTEQAWIHAEDFCMCQLWNRGPPTDATAQLPIVRATTYRTISRETRQRRAAYRRTRPAGTGNRSTAPARRRDATFGPSGTRRSAPARRTRTELLVTLWLVVALEIVLPVPGILTLGAVWVLARRPAWFAEIVRELYAR